MEDETVDLIEVNDDHEEECWIIRTNESETLDDTNINNFSNDNSGQELVFIDSNDLTTNDGNDITVQYIEEDNNDNDYTDQDNYNSGQGLVFIDSNDLATNDGNDITLQYIEEDNNDNAYTDQDNEAQFEINNDIDDNNIKVHQEKLDNIDEINKHTLILRETINENDQLVEGYFCQQCNMAFNTIEDFLAYHPNTELLDEDPQTQDAQTSASAELWDLVENFDQKADTESAIMELKPNVNSIDMENERYFCCHCQEVFKDLNTAETHDCTSDLQTTENTDKSLLIENNVYRCHLCDKDYSSLRSFTNHQRWHKKSAEQLGYTKTLHKVSAVCEICRTVFESEKNLKLHMKMHKKHAVKTIQDALPVGAQNEYKDLNQFFCEICNKSFDQKLLLIHKNMHQNVEEYVCGKCNKQFENLPSYEIHLQMHVDNMNNAKTFATTKNNPKATTIIECSPSTSSQTSSVTVRADGKRKHACQYCGKEFMRPYEKVKHERIHTGEKPYECEVCGKTFRVSYSLTLHLRTHTDIRPYVCATCNKRFKQQSVYVHHMKTHLNERDYKCGICGKSFRTSVQLSGHKNIHSKPYNCTECNRPFASLYAVKIHMKTHNKCHKSNKNLKNSCSICGASYARLFALRLHIKEQHGIDLDPLQLLDSTSNTNNTEKHKVMDVETAILMSAAKEASHQQMNFINDADDEENNRHDSENDSEVDGEVLGKQIDHEENIENHLPNTSYLDETEAATQTILNTEKINVDNFHAEEIITDSLSI